MVDETELTLEQKIKRLQGPILVLGGSGFVGANLVQTHNTGSGADYTSRFYTYPDGDIIEDRVALSVAARDLVESDQRIDRIERCVSESQVGSHCG